MSTTPTQTAQGKLARALIVTAEVCGTELSTLAAEAMARELATHPAGAVAEALRRCQRELAGRLTLAAVLSRIDTGHPGAEEAWALCPRDEDATVVWTSEMADAYGVAAALLREGDQVAARMAFRERYTELVRKANDARRPARWVASLGHDPAGRDAVLLEAVEKGRLTAGHVERMLTADAGRERLARLTGGERKALPAPKVAEPAPEYLPPEQIAALARQVLDARRMKP